MWRLALLAPVDKVLINRGERVCDSGDKLLVRLHRLPRNLKGDLSACTGKAMSSNT